MLMRLLKRAGHLSKSKVTLAFRHGVTNGSTQTDKMIDLGETMGSQGGIVLPRELDTLISYLGVISIPQRHSRRGPTTSLL